MRITTKLLCFLSFALLSLEKIYLSNGNRNKEEYVHCNAKGRSNTQYFLGSNARLNWSGAQQICKHKDNNSHLPIIRDKKEQRELENYLKCLQKNSTDIYSVWTSGKKETYNNWTWINGQTLDYDARIFSTTNSEEDNKIKTHILWTYDNGGAFKQENPLAEAWYLCQKNDAASDGQCNHKNQIKLANSCLTASEYGNTSWYKARSECISKGEDLAVILSYQDFQKHKNHSTIQNHWIGLREVNWIWNMNNNQGSEEIKYTKWSGSRPPSSSEEMCIGVNVLDGLWTQKECSYEMSVVCEKGNGQTTNPTTTISSTAESTTMKHTIANSAMNGISQTDGGSLPKDNQEVIGIVVVVIVIIIICLIIIVIVVVCRKKSAKDETESKPKVSQIEAQKAKGIEMVPPKPDEMGTVYAEIPPLSGPIINDNPEGAKQGILYASLDFQPGAIYAEPMKTRNSQNVSGSAAAGPVYAEPLKGAENHNGANSAQTTKIGPKGDVYTLPSSGVTPPLAKMTQAPIYANT